MDLKQRASAVWRNAPLRLLAIAYAVTVVLLSYNYATELLFASPPNYTGGSIINQLMRVMSGGHLYASDLSHPPYTFNPYGPVYYLLQYPLFALVGPSFRYGELISLASHVASAYLAWRIMRLVTGSSVSAAVSSMVILASPYLGGVFPLYRVDMLAQALSLAGIYAGLTAKMRKGYCLTALLFTAAIYTKLTYALAGPVAVLCLHAWQGRRRQALAQGVWLLAFSALAFAVCQWVTAGGFFFNIVTANLLHYSLGVALGFVFLLLCLSVGACAVIPELWRRRAAMPEASRFVALYLIFALISAMAIGRAGATYWYCSELEVALAFVFGVAAAPDAGNPKSIRNSHTLLALQLMVYWWMLATSPYHVSLRTSEQGAVPRLQEIIAAADGPVLAAEYMGLVALTTHHPIYFDPTPMTQLYYVNRWSQEAFLRDLRNGMFPVLLITQTKGPDKHRWTTEMLEAINARYYVAETIGKTEVWRVRSRH